MLKRIDILASKYFVDELDKVESAELRSLIRNPEHKERFEWFRKNWKGEPVDSELNFNVQRGKELTAEKIQQAEAGFVFPGSDSTAVVSSEKRWIFRSKNLLRIAASMVLIAGSAIALNTYINRPIEKEMAVQYSEISTELGQLSDVALPDGSSVLLNSSSSFIRYSEFSNKDRVVQLSGEAYFEIASDPARPFIIHVHQVVIEVMGTKFNIKAYPEDDIVSVSVVEGTVRISRTNLEAEEWTVIGAGKEFLLNHKTQDVDVKEFSEERVLGWREGKFIFESSPLQIVLPILSRKFDVEFVLENESLNDCQLTAEFDNESLETILDVISFANDINYEFKGRRIILNGHGCTR